MSYYTFLIGLSGVLVLSLILHTWNFIRILRLKIHDNWTQWTKLIIINSVIGIASCFMLLTFCWNLFLILKEIDPAGVL